MNLEADNTILEDYGAGFEGTNALRDKYIKDTPGQRIQQFNTTMKDSKEKLETEIEEAKDPKQAADFQRVMYGLMKQDDYNKKWKLGKYRPAGNKLAGPGGLYKNLLMPSKKESELEEAFGESWVVYNKDTKAKIKPFKTRKGAYEYAAKNGGVVYSGEYYHDHQDDINSGKLVKEESLDEAQNLVSKGIYTFDGKKIDGARSSKLFLQALDSDGFLHNLSWKEWSESDLKDTSSDNAKKQFVDRLAKEIKMFNKRIDLNTWLKGGDRSFTDTVNYIFKLDPNIKYAKASGLKEESLQEAVTSKEISQIKNEFDMELIPQSKWAKNYQTNVRKVKQLYGIPQGNGEYDDVYFVIYDDENKPYGVVDIEGTSMYAKFSDAKAGLKFALNSMEESLQEAVPKIDVEELLDAAAKMRKEMPALRKGQSIMITLHNMNPKLYSMAVDKADAFTVDAKIPDLINFLDPKYYAESTNLDEAMEPQNTSYGYYGTVDVEKYKLIAYKEMADTVLKIVRAKKIFANFPNITSNADQESAVVKYLDSKHGRHIADGNDSPAYIEKDFTKFLKDFAAGHYMESSGLEEGRFFNVRDYMATSEKSQFGGYRPHIVDKAGKTMYLSAAAYNTPDEAKDHAEEYLKQYARGISEPRVPIKGTYVKEAINIRDYMATSEKSQFGGYRPHIVDKAGKTMYLGQASYNTPDEAKDHAENYLKQYARGIGEPRVPVKGTYVKESTEEISLEERRQMKIVALATGSTDLDKIYEYVATQPVQYSSIVELKENFNKYINNA